MLIIQICLSFSRCVVATDSKIWRKKSGVDFRMWFHPKISSKSIPWLANTTWMLWRWSVSSCEFLFFLNLEKSVIVIAPGRIVALFWRSRRTKRWTRIFSRNCFSRRTMIEFISTLFCVDFACYLLLWIVGKLFCSVFVFIYWSESSIYFLIIFF